MKTILTILLAMVVSLISSSCVNMPPTITPDRCVLFTFQDKNGNKYRAGICEDERYVVQWENQDGYILRAEFINKDEDEYKLKYFDPTTEIWIEWSSKSGISLDGMPLNIQSATRA